MLNPQLHNISVDYNYTNSISGYLRINILNSKQEMCKGIANWF